MSSLIDPAALLWLFLLLFGLGLLAKRHWRCGVLPLGLCAVWWLVEVTGTPGRLLASLEKPYLGAEIPAEADAIIVLGGGAGLSLHEFAELDFGLAADRILMGAELSRRGIGKVLVLGGSATLKPEVAPEPRRLRRWLETWEVPRSPMLDLGPCRNTRDEALRAAELVREHGWSRVLLVTSASHMKRSERTFQVVGIDVVPVACDFTGTVAVERGSRWVPQAESLVLLQLWLHEVVGMWYYRARGWV
jgi:uncharacterized SAM-binding protein YcdF (DUF218 family)